MPWLELLPSLPFSPKIPEPEPLLCVYPRNMQCGNKWLWPLPLILHHWYSLRICTTATTHERKDDMSSAESSDFTGNQYPNMELCNITIMEWLMSITSCELKRVFARKVHSLVSHQSSAWLCCCVVSCHSSPGKNSYEDIVPEVQFTMKHSACRYAHWWNARAGSETLCKSKWFQIVLFIKRFPPLVSSLSSWCFVLGFFLLLVQKFTRLVLIFFPCIILSPKTNGN